MVSFASSIMRNVVVFASESGAKFLLKLICCIAFRSASSACCLHKCIAIILKCSWKWRLFRKQPVEQSSPWPVSIFRMLSYVLISLSIVWSKRIFYHHNLVVFYSYFSKKISYVSCYIVIILIKKNKKSIFSLKIWVS